MGLNGYGLPGKRKFSDVKDTAKQLMLECTSGWPMIEDVDAIPDRFASASVRLDLPSLDEAKKDYFKHVDPGARTAVTPATIWAASMNAKLSKQRLGRAFDFCKDGLPAISFVTPPKEATQAPLIFLVTDKVRTAIHLVPCRREDYRDDDGSIRVRYALKSPWTFAKSHNVLLRFYNMLKHRVCTNIAVVEFLVHVHEDSCVLSTAYSLLLC